MAEEIPAPSSIDEVDTLIQRLYNPATPSELVPRIQSKLVELQKSEEGWRMGDALLDRPDPNVRFFGCLTLTVKLNSDWEAVGEDNLLPLLKSLVVQFRRLVASHERPMVLQKFCSTLVTYFLKPSSVWTHCIHHLITCLVASDYVAEDSLPSHGSVQELLPRLDVNQLVAILWFSRCLAEEGKRADANSSKQSPIVQRIEANASDVVAVMHYAFSHATTPPLPVGGSARETSEQEQTILEATFQCWMQWNYVANAYWTGKNESIAKFQSLTDFALQCCFLDDNTLGEDATNGIIDLMTVYGAFFEKPQLASVSAMIRGPWGHERADPSNSEFVNFGRFLLAYGDAALQDLVQGSEPETEEIMRLMHELLKTPGYAVEDDEIVIWAVEFWVSYAEYAMDTAQIVSAGGAENTSEATRVREHMMNAMMEFWQKIRYPPPDTVEGWSYDDKLTFTSFRTDVKDLFLTSYETIGDELIRQLASMLEQSLAARAWWHLEASMFALSGFSESMDEDDPANDYIARIFGSTLFTDLAAAGDEVPTVTQRSAVDFLGSFSNFFEMHLDLLPSALNFLFATLKSPSLTNSAARSIVSLCSACRKELTSELESFFAKYEEVLTWKSVDIQTKERLVGAISAIAQTIESDDITLKAANRILNFIAHDTEACFRQMEEGETDQAREMAMSALACLASMAVSFQAPDEAVIDLEADKHFYQQPNFWNSGPGSSFQQRAVSYLGQIFRAFSQDGEIYERGFQVLKAGFAESIPGPFVFPPGVAINFFCQSSLEYPRLDVALSAMGALVKSRGSTLHARDLDPLIKHVFDLMEELDDPAEDPELAQTLVEVAETLIKGHLHQLLALGDAAVAQMFNFTLKALQGGDVLPRRSAAAFWTTFIPLTRKVAGADRVFEHYGPSLSVILINLLCGEAARSELKNLCDPLRALIKSDPKAKPWLETALRNEAFPSTRVDDGHKNKFLQTLMMTRGDAKTTHVVTEFWIMCRGTVQSYN